MTKDKKKLKVAFPHMGTVYIAWSAALKKIGVEPFVPPYTSKKTLSLGTKHSPSGILNGLCDTINIFILFSFVMVYS